MWWCTRGRLCISPGASIPLSRVLLILMLLLLLLYLLMLMLQVVELLLHLLETWHLEGGGIAIHWEGRGAGAGAPDRSPC